ncbi:Clp protease N-terminal domain-containing protein [Amycolatopsis anabasis]|uniref:Clp protease N-terminal domain-containing protein n=1 Tax=Amycolatopsis anabasis TaxID=1840409 RepID=UPI00131B80F8|nr:Clp protease N-terminal domain-containing protein [Amycolatopsis anabasis]
MPKINVYLPDELAESVKEAGVPVSAICQRALEQSVKRVNAIRATALDELDAEDPTARLAQFTERARVAIRLGIDRARADAGPRVGTEHLLHGLLAEGGNLALHVLRAVEIEPDQLARELARISPAQAHDPPAPRFGGAAANALELAVTEAVTLGHNYIGCEHLLLGLVAEPDGTGGQILRAAGAELRSARGAVVAALAGYVHLRAQATGGPADAVAATVRRELRPLVDRVARLEKHVGVAAEDGE